MLERRIDHRVRGALHQCIRPRPPDDHIDVTEGTGHRTEVHPHQLPKVNNNLWVSRGTALSSNGASARDPPKVRLRTQDKQGTAELRTTCCLSRKTPSSKILKINPRHDTGRCLAMHPPVSSHQSRSGAPSRGASAHTRIYREVVGEEEASKKSTRPG